MNIAYLSDSIIPSTFANSVNVMKTCAAFAECGHEVTLFARQGRLFAGDDYQKYGVANSFRIVKSWRPRVFLTKKLRRKIYILQLRRHFAKLPGPPELIYGRDIISFKELAGLGIPMIYEAHYFPKKPDEIATFADVFQCGNFKRLVVITEALRDIYLNLFPWLQPKILVAQNATDIPQPSDRETGGWPGRADCLQAGYIGQLRQGKGMDIIARIAMQAQDVDFHIIGGVPKDIEYWRQKCPIRNLFFHGYIDHGKLGGYFPKLDVLLAPYTGGEINNIRSPLKVVEYMARCKPVLASDIPIIREILQDKVNALLAPPEDINAWVRALIRLKCDQKLAAKIAAKAYEDFLASYTWERRVKLVLG